MVPIILAGMAVARLVTPIIAKKLIRDGLGKAATKSVKISPNKPITNMNQLPKHMQQTAKPSTVKNTGKRTMKEVKALKERTQRNRQQVKQPAPKSEVMSVPQKIRRGVEAQAKLEQKISSQSAQKLRGAEQVRGASRTTPKDQKGMRFPAKGEIVRRRKGGVARKTRVF